MKNFEAKAFAITLILIAGCAEQNTPEGGSSTSVSENRSFLMGMTPWPYDFTEEAVDNTYRTVAEHTDLIVHHFDNGIPWEEALTGKPYHRNVVNEIKTRVNHLEKGKKVYVSVTPLSFDRKRLADYWGEETNMERTGKWKSKEYDDPEVIKAYTNFCRYLIEQFDPTYMAYGIEVDLGLLDSESLEKFLVLAEKVYTTLKKENPDLSLFLTFHLGDTPDEEAKRSADRRLLEYSDLVAISVYPYWVSESMEANPQNLPRNLFSQMADLAPEKPFAVSETGYIAEDLTMKTYGITLKGKEEWQAAYVKFLLEECNRLHAEFVIWFVSRDYDGGWEKLEAMRFDELFKMWKDTGLLDGDGNVREGLLVWDSWLALPQVVRDSLLSHLLAEDMY